MRVASARDNIRPHALFWQRLMPVQVNENWQPASLLMRLRVVFLTVQRVFENGDRRRGCDRLKL